MDIITLIFAIQTVLWLFIAELAFRSLGRTFGFYAILQEKEARVYVLFGDIVGTIQEPGFHFLWLEFGWKAFFVNWLGRSYSRSLSLDQEYLRSIPVNSEEGTPMGIGVWCEMFITDPVAHIFRNVDPPGFTEREHQKRDDQAFEQFAVAGNADQPAHDELGRPRGGLLGIDPMGL